MKIGAFSFYWLITLTGGFSAGWVTSIVANSLAI
jgi:hypothetical protein